MKDYRWLPIVAALLVTVSEVLIFKAQLAHVPAQQVNIAAGTHAEGYGCNGRVNLTAGTDRTS